MGGFLDVKITTLSGGQISAKLYVTNHGVSRQRWYLRL